MTAWIEGECNTGVGFEQYVNWRRRDPFEVEHIWADKFERDGVEFDNPYDFADQRHRFGGLLLLPKSFNASFGDDKYEDKVPHYFGRNLLAASLNSLAYQKNPSFVSFAQRTGLPFVPYPERFRQADMEERQELYRQICEQVWNPDRLGLGGGTPSNNATKESRKAFYGVRLADLIQAGLLDVGETLKGARLGTEYRATLLPPGKVRIEGGREFDTLSGAADHLTGKSNNGWEFWRVVRSGTWGELGRIREEYLAG